MKKLFLTIMALALGSVCLLIAKITTNVSTKSHQTNKINYPLSNTIVSTNITKAPNGTPNNPAQELLPIKVADGESAIGQSKSKWHDTPVNTWIKISEETTGTRDWPLFYYDNIRNKFILHGGEPKGPAHFDTEQFDLELAKWTNVYPLNAPYKTESGPTDAPFLGFSDKEPGIKADKNGVMRLLRGLNPYIRDPGMFFQGAFNPSDGKTYAYFQNGTIAYNSKTQDWIDLKTPKFNKCPSENWLLYGSLAYDPINNEYISIGGTSDEDGGTPGTWIYSISEGKWNKHTSGSSALKELNSTAKALRIKLASFLNACRNRFYITESETEGKINLATKANDLAASFDDFYSNLNKSKLSGYEINLPKMAMAENNKVAKGLKEISIKLNKKIDGDALVELQTYLEIAERVERILDTEPCGRAASQLASCNATGKIVLFSGCRMDGYIADTWVYDCKSRTWEQRFPKICPAPRAGHMLSWLPKSKKVILYGAIPFTSPYTVPRQTPPPTKEIWIYDLETNEWKLLVSPTVESPVCVVGAIDANDNLVVVSYDGKNRNARTTWALKVDPSKKEANSENTGVVAGSVSNVFDHASVFDKVTKIDQEGIKKVLDNVTPNQWTLMPKPPKMSNNHAWGTSPYDSVRHQLLSFGGGHSAAHYTDVTHYSIQSATWSWGYGEEYPYFNASFSAMFNQTFRNRPTIPTHVWDCAAFDEVTGKAVYCIRGGTWIYDPANREWEYPPVWGSEGGSFANMKGTPKGVVFWGRGDGRVNGDLKLFNYSAKKWELLPIKGGGVPVAFGDTGGMCYDSKRDSIWLAHFGSPMLCYDMKTGNLTQDSNTGKPANIYMRGTAYIPEIDMLLNVGRVTSADGQVGNLAYDIQNKKWVGIQFPCSDGLPRVNDKPYSEINLSLYYDEKLKLLIFHSNEMEVLVARINKTSLKFFDAKILPK